MDYKEKLKLAKEALESGSYDKETIEYIFPELAESEDERIRKAIINLVDTEFGDRFPFDGFTREQMLAWLEKQGEQKPVKSGLYMCTTEEANTLNIAAPKFCVGSTYEYDKNKGINIGGGWLGISDDTLLKYFCYTGDKGEQKSADKIDQYSLPVSEDISLPTFDESIYHPCTESVHEQESSKWSGEDELHIRELESLVKQVWAKAEHENDKDTIHKMSDLSFFLKTLNPAKKGEQIPAEWSEEDESHIRYLIECLEHCKKGVALTMTTSTLQEYINWLKSIRPQKQDVMSEDEFRHIVGYLVQDIMANEHMSVAEMQPTNFFAEKYYNKLRPQSQWKPSDEQMRVLDLAIRCGINRGTTEETTLVSLFNDLKKLK